MIRFICKIPLFFKGLGLALLLGLWVTGSPLAAEPADRSGDPSPPASSPGWGPFSIATQSPLQVFRLAFMHQAPSLPPAGGMTFGATATWGNYWAYRPERLLLDAEYWNFSPMIEYGLSNRAAISIRVPVLYLTGGVLDGGIENFHANFNLGDQRRQEFPRKQVRVEVINTAGEFVTLLDRDDKGPGIRAPIISARWRITGPGAKLPLTLTGSVNVPALETEVALVEKNGADAAIGISGALRLGGRWASTFSLAGIHSRAARESLFLDLNQNLASFLVSLDYQFSNRGAAIAQLGHETAVAENTGTGLDDGTTDFLIGIKCDLGGGYVLEVAFFENLFIHDNNADVAFHAGIQAQLL